MADSGEYRIEHDTMGEVRVPAKALWRAQTQRAVENFPISGRGLERTQIRALGLLKGACAQVNKDLGLLARGEGRRDHRRRRRDRRRPARRPVPDRRLPDRLGHQLQHEHQRGDRQHRGRQRCDRAPQRRRQHVAVVQRHLPDRHPHRGHRSRGAPSHSGARGTARRAGSQSPRVAHRGQVGPHPPDGRRPGDAGPGVLRIRPPDRGRHRAGAVRRCPGWANWRSAEPRSAPGSTPPTASAPRWSRSWSPTPDWTNCARRQTLSRPRPPATGWSRRPARCAPSRCR